MLKHFFSFFCFLSGASLIASSSSDPVGELRKSLAELMNRNNELSRLAAASITPPVTPLILDDEIPTPGPRTPRSSGTRSEESRRRIVRFVLPSERPSGRRHVGYTRHLVAEQSGSSTTDTISWVDLTAETE